MRPLAVITLTLIVSVATAAETQSGWTDSSYEPWDAKIFQRLTQQPIDPDHLDLSVLSAAIFLETNEARKREGLAPLAFNPMCRVAAQRYCDDMVRLNFFDGAHGHPDKALANPKLRMTVAGLTGAWAWGENIAIAFGLQYKSGDSFYPPQAPGQPFLDTQQRPIPAHTYATFAAAVVDQWMHSPHHRANILDKDWTHVGAACTAFTEDGFPKLKCTQDFTRLGRPLPRP
jgi:uncharacterized protein YkwD